MVGQMKHTVEGGRYADIPIPDFVDIILNGDDEAMYYLLQKRLKPLLYQRYKTYSQHLYDDYEDIVEEFFIYVRESGHTPYQALRRIKKKEAFESWILRTFRNYLNNRSEAESHLSFADEECGNMPFPAEESAMNGEIKIRGAKGSGTSVSQIRDYLLNNRNHCRDIFYLLKTIKRDFFIKRRFHLLRFSA
jgi:DNA-directed RNA polymerase specialized sigma24 family protein